MKLMEAELVELRQIEYMLYYYKLVIVLVEAMVVFLHLDLLIRWDILH